jgi:hypothetical protein
MAADHTNQQLSAAIARISELKVMVQSFDTEVATLSRRLESVEAETVALVANKESELSAQLDADRAAMDDQLEADVLLTVHFQDTANQQVVRALIDKQDAGIREEELALRQKLMEIAESELKEREDELIIVHESIKSNLLKIDEDSHTASIQAAYLQHKEIMAKLS